MPDIKIFNPDTLGKPLGQYSQITRVKASEFVFIAGQVGADRDGKVGEDFDAQCAPRLCQHRDGAEIGRRRLGQCGGVHDLSGALARTFRSS